MKSRFTAIFAVALMLAACAADKPVSLTEQSADTVSESTTSAQITDESHTSAETVTETVAESVTSTETTSESGADEDDACADREYVYITEDSRFYPCQYVTPDNVSGEDFADADLLARARDAVLSSAVYTDVWNRASAGLSEGTEPPLELVCAEVLSRDLNGDGSDENAFLFRLTVLPDFDDEEDYQAAWWAADPNAPCILALYGGGEFLVPDKKYAVNAELMLLDYGDFAHLVIDGGVSNNSSRADYFSFDGGGFTLELSEFRAYTIRDGIFLSQSMAQCSNVWLIFWDGTRYVTPEAVQLSQAERDEIFPQLPLDEDMKSRFANSPICVIGNKYYSVYDENHYSLTFRMTDDGFVRELFEPHGYGDGLNERRLRYMDEFYIPYARGFDYDRALESII